MSLFICDKCGCVDNTACGGTYWIHRSDMYSGENSWADKLVLCVECKPKEYSDGSIDDNAGKWHNEFKKRPWEFYGNKEELLKEVGFVHVKEYFERI